MMNIEYVYKFTYYTTAGHQTRAKLLKSDNNDSMKNLIDIFHAMVMNNMNIDFFHIQKNYLHEVKKMY